VAKTWSLFTSHGTAPSDIKAWNPLDGKYDRPLNYYGLTRGFGGDQPASTTDLLESSDGFGECYSFGQLFQDALWANGVNTAGILVRAKNWTSSNHILLIIKDFTPSAIGSMPSSAAPFLWKMIFSASPGEMQPPPNTSTTYGTYGDFVNLETHSGQNTKPPLEKVFDNHYIIQCGSIYYDPSYGVTYTSENDFETKSVQGYGQHIPSDAVNLEVEPSAGLQNIQFQPITRHHQ